MPLCLLTRDMQNRRIIDRLFAEGGAAKPKVAIETNSVVALMAHVRLGQMVERDPTYVPGLLGQRQDALCRPEYRPAGEPEASHSVGLVVSERDPLPPLARALLKSARENDLAGVLGPDGIASH